MYFGLCIVFIMAVHVVYFYESKGTYRSYGCDRKSRPTGFKHVQLGLNTSKHVQRCVQTRAIMYKAIVFNFTI